jgi:hypothetical protein
MLPLFKHVLFAFFLDELAFRRWVRGGMLAFAGGGLAFADQIGALLSWPDAVKAVKIAAIVCGFIAGAMQSSAKKSGDVAAPPAAGFVRVAVLVAIVAGVLQAVLVGAAFASFGLRAHGWAVFCIAAGAAQAWLIVRAFPDRTMW